MADQTKIEWTDATWNPITGCSMVSAGCTNCYAMGLAATRLRHHPSRAGLTRETGGRPVWTGEVRLNEEWLDQPLRWKRPRRIFVCAHGDLFHEAVPDEWIDRVFAVMALAPQHTFQVLTKRPERMREYFEARPWIRIAERILEPIEATGRITFVDWRENIRDRLPLPNVWIGTSIEDQATADARIPHLLATPAAVRFASAEPLLGPVDLNRIGTVDILRKIHPRHMAWIESGKNITSATISALHNGMIFEAENILDCGVSGKGGLQKLDLVIVGGESGKHARPLHPDWVRDLRDQCVAAGVPFFFKQWGEWMPWQETGSVPYWRSGGGHEQDRHVLFPSDWDNAPDWDDGISIGIGAYRHAAFQRIGKARAGRLLDGREWNEMPGVRYE